MDVWRQAGAAGLVVLAVAMGAGEARAQAGGAPGGKTRLEQLAWLAGSWVSDSAGVRSEEHQRILYWREGDRLRARVEGILEGRRMSEDYAWRRVESGP